MKKIRVLLVGALAAGSVFMAAPAQASCQSNPDVGDICVLTDKVKETLCANKIYQLTGRC